MDIIKDLEELEIFDAESVQTMIEYKWKTYGIMHHYLGVIMHIFYILTVLAYV